MNRVRKSVELSLAFFIAVIGLAVAPAVLALAESEQAREKPQTVEKERASEKQVKKDAAQTRVQDSGEQLKTAAAERREKRENAREAVQAIRTRVADADSRKVEALDRARLKEVAELAPEEAKARLAKLKVVKADENFKVRPITAEKLLERKATFEKLKEAERSVKEENKEKLDRLKEAKERLRVCGSEEDECRKAATDAVERAKEAALKTADRLVNHLNKLKEKILSSENMPEDEAATRASRIDAAIAEVEAVKQKITEAATKEEFNAAARELKKLVNKAKHISESHSQGFLRAEINGVIHRAEVSEKKLDCALATLEANGTDTSAVDAKIAEFSSKMGAARDKLRKAKELLGSESESDDEAKKAEAGKMLIREAKELVQEAHRMLEDIRKDVRELGGKPCEKEQELVIEQEGEGERK